jgi:hypothetical protein
MQLRSSGDDSATVELKCIASISTDTSSSDLHQGDTRRKIPRRQTPFPVAVLTPCGDEGQVDGCGTAAPNSSGAMGEPAKLCVVVVQACVSVVGESSDE